MSELRTIAVFTWGVWRVPRLAELCGAQEVLFRPSSARANDIDAVVVWGNKPTSRRGLAYALRHHLPCLRAEDGFLRSVGLGVNGAAPLSIVLDDEGIYYDARKASRIERLLAESTKALDDETTIDRARRAIARITEAGLSKYNCAPPIEPDLPATDRPRVLVVDQTRGDLSVRCGLAGSKSFEAMLAAALEENPGAEIVVKTHPDVLAGKKRGYLEAPRGDRIRLFADDVPAHALLSGMSRVYAVTSQLGFEALMAGKPVSCFGAPWYAGWGATDDRIEVPRRGRSRSVEQLFAAAYILYARYLDPTTGRPGDLEDVIEHLALQRRHFADNRGKLICFGFRFWKRGYMKAYLRCPGNEITFASNAKDAEESGIDQSTRLLVWGQRESAEVRALAERQGLRLSRVEDGFLRSVGLGSDLAMPASLVFDRSGIYYDPNGPSDLETILETAHFPAHEVERARKLRRRIVTAGLSKYNVGGDTQLFVPEDKRIVLVPGQVEDDASIQLGCRDIRTNLALIRETRRARPDAYIIFKPHPDVLSGNRRGAVPTAEALQHCDHVETEASLAPCLAAADEVHTMTSLVGFEALLREKQVVVYGQPFYAGWGLTEDRHHVSRRTRRLELDELVAGTLLRYPRYLDRDSYAFTTPEETIDKLLAERDGAGDRRVQMTWLRRQLRKVHFAYKGIVHAR